MDPTIKHVQHVHILVCRLVRDVKRAFFVLKDEETRTIISILTYFNKTVLHLLHYEAFVRRQCAVYNVQYLLQDIMKTYSRQTL